MTSGNARHIDHPQRQGGSAKAPSPNTTPDKSAPADSFFGYRVTPNGSTRDSPLVIPGHARRGRAGPGDDARGSADDRGHTHTPATISSLLAPALIPVVDMS